MPAPEKKNRSSSIDKRSTLFVVDKISQPLSQESFSVGNMVACCGDIGTASAATLSAQTAQEKYKKKYNQNLERDSSLLWRHLVIDLLLLLPHHLKFYMRRLYLLLRLSGGISFFLDYVKGFPFRRYNKTNGCMRRPAARSHLYLLF